MKINYQRCNNPQRRKLVLEAYGEAIARRLDAQRRYDLAHGTAAREAANKLQRATQTLNDIKPLVASLFANEGA